MATESDDSDDSKITWSSYSGKYDYSANGKTDVLFIISESPDNVDAVLRRPRELTDDERRKLESQGIPRDCHHSDLTIMKARLGLDYQYQIVGVESSDSGRELTCEGVKKQIASLMNNTSKAGVSIYYIGAGKKGTGDWCFSDGFITFRELTDLYMSNQHFRGRVLDILSDCSHSGSWVKESMEFMDEQGVGPCGHVAKDKGILLEVMASCLSNEIPSRGAVSVHSYSNDKNTKELDLTFEMLCNKVFRDQHPSGVNFTTVQCKSTIDEPCTMAPGSTWQKWSTSERVRLVKIEDNIQPTWSYILLVDDDETIYAHFKDMQSNEPVDLNDYGQVLKSGWGTELPQEVKEWADRNYRVDYNYSSS